MNLPGTKRACRAFLTTCAFALLSAALAASAGAAEPVPACDGSLQARIDAASPGDTVNLSGACVYREAVRVDKPLTLDGGGEGGIRGSDVWDGWEKTGALWTSSKAVPSFSVPSRYRCETGQQCRWPEQVFVDGEPQEQVASDPDPGQFALDGDRRVVLADNPTDRIVEVTVRPTWIVGASADVTVRGITMKHAAENGLWNGGRPGWTVEDNDLSYAHARNLTLTLADSLVARDNDVHHGGQMGIGSHDAGVEIVGNRVYANNVENFQTDWEAGGMKVTRARGAIISGNEVYDNRTIGIWTDVVSEGQGSVKVSGNRVYHHDREGIRVEITKNFAVRKNVVWENGWGEGDSYTGAGISVNGSRDGIVEDNVLAWNASGIGVVQQDRHRANEQSYDTVSNVTLKANKVLQDEIPGSSNHAAVFWNRDPQAIAAGAPSIFAPEVNNGGKDGLYWFDEPQGDTPRFKWDRQLRELDDYNATPAEQDGRYLSEREKDGLIEENGLPASPGGRPQVASGLLSRIGDAIGRIWDMLP